MITSVLEKSLSAKLSASSIILEQTKSTRLASLSGGSTDSGTCVPLAAYPPVFKGFGVRTGGQATSGTRDELTWNA
ncbi:MAG: hypothetical protein AAGI30_09055, partial [Planctomycetota bacterium]